MNWWRVVGRIVAGLAVLVACLGAAMTFTIGAGTGAGPPSLTPAQTDAVLDRAATATVGVSAQTCDGVMSGTGFVVEGRVVTSHHLVRGAAVMEVTLPSGAVVPLAVERVSSLDLALSGSLPATGPDLELELASRGAEAGQPVVAVGWVDGQLRWVSARVQLVTAGPAYGQDAPVLLLDRALDRGWSGGAVLDGDGAVVGVVRAVDLSTGLTVVVPQSDLRQWLKTDIDVDGLASCVG